MHTSCGIKSFGANQSHCTYWFGPNNAFKAALTIGGLESARRSFVIGKAHTELRLLGIKHKEAQMTLTFLRLQAKTQSLL